MISKCLTSIKQCLAEKSNAWVVAGAVLLGLSVPGIGAWPLAWVGLVPALLAMSWGKRWPLALWHGFLLGTVYHLFVFLWFPALHPVTWIGLPGWASMLVSLAGWIASAISQGIIVALIWLCIYWLWNRRTGVFQMGAPVFWVAGLWFLNQTPIGLPWGFLAYSQAAVPLVRESTYAITFWGLEAFMVLVNVAVFQALYYGQKFRLLPAVFAVIIILIDGVIINPPASTVLEDNDPVAVQGNIHLEVERRQLTAGEKLAYYQQLINIAAERFPNSRMILLPEGVVFLPGKQQTNPFTVPENMALFTGGLFRQNGNIYNGAVLFAGDQVQTFGKRYLVPFGEATPIVPEDWLVRRLNAMGIAYARGFQSAPANQPLMRHGDLTIAPFICFEAMYPNLSLHYRVEGAHLLVNISNLGWYHQNHFLERQFLAANRLRAAEAGVPMIVVTNTGVSAIIDAAGNIVAEADSDKTQLLTITGPETVNVRRKFREDPDEIPASQAVPPLAVPKRL